VPTFFDGYDDLVKTLYIKNAGELASVRSLVRIFENSRGTHRYGPSQSLCPLLEMWIKILREVKIHKAKAVSLASHW
jgi:hypothetical protein